MAWEQVIPFRAGRCRYGMDWQKYPAVSVSANSIGFNAAFQDSFSCKVGSRVLIFIDAVEHRLGVKLLGTNDIADGALILRVANKETGHGGALTVVSMAVINKIKDAVGYAYRAHLNAGERIIEVSLDPSNRTR